MDFTKLASKESIEKTIQSLAGRGVEAILAENGTEALAKTKELIPAGASVMNGSSVTLEQIGFVDYLKSGTHGWNNVHEAIINESEPGKKAKLRKESVLSDYYLGSIHALTEAGEFIIASQTGSQLPHIVYTSQNIIFVASVKKIVPSLEFAFKRLYEHVIPLEEKHMQEKYGMGTNPNKIVIWNGEATVNKRQARLILVNEDLGF